MATEAYWGILSKSILPPTSFDQDYLTRLRDGDPETERHFISHFTSVIGMAMRCRLRSGELINDIRQETFLRVFKFLRSDKSLERPEKLPAFVQSVSVNVMLEQLRASGRHPPLPEQTETIADARENPEREAVTKERKAIVRALVEELGGKDSEILRAVFLEEGDKDLICRRFGVERAYLRVLIHRAKNKFREMCQERGVPPF